VRIISLDTSTPITSCALLEDDAVVWEKQLHEKAGDVLPSALGDLEGIEGVAVGLGPGSFTGLRVGLAAAKALSYARRLPIAGVSSLRALAFPEAGLVCAATDARRNELFTQFFLDGVAQSEVRVVFAADLKLGGVGFAGDGRSANARSIGGSARLVKGTPSAAVIARLCLSRLREEPYDAAACFALAPDYRQGFANLT
jgi:tRNA threonylcarbamoyladenosine biosynthesis protein TsaB